MSDQNVPTTPSVFIFGLLVDSQSVKDFVINLEDWSRRNPGRPLRIDLNSGGGNILDALFLYQEFNRIRKNGHHLTIAVYGRASSCAAWLVQAADWRIIGAESWVLVHQVSSKVDGPIFAVERELARMRELQAQTNDILIKRTALTEATINEHIANGTDWWINADDAWSKYKIVDEVEENKPFISAPFDAATVTTASGA
jgi:ATP-dependent protease ClpP protease subunit